jgi:DNA polymerase-3 subunit alpha
VDLRAVNRSTIEALIKCGAFDALGANRAAMVAAVDHAIEMGQSAASERKSGQMNFFGGSLALPQGDAAPRFPDVEPWSEAQLLKAEKETLGFYITSHPLVRYGRELTMLSTPARVNLAGIGQCAGRISIGCMIAAVRPTVTKNGRSAGKKMAMLTVEDLTGKCDAVVFSETYEQFANLVKPDAMVFLAGSVDTRRERPSIVVDEILPIDSAIEMLTAGLTLKVGQALAGATSSPSFGEGVSGACEEAHLRTRREGVAPGDVGKDAASAQSAIGNPPSPNSGYGGPSPQSAMLLRLQEILL